MAGKSLLIVVTVAEIILLEFFFLFALEEVQSKLIGTLYKLVEKQVKRI